MMLTVCKVLARNRHMQRLVVFADKGLLSIDNLDELASINLLSGMALEFVLAVLGRRYKEFVELLQPVHEAAAEEAGETIAQALGRGTT